MYGTTTNKKAVLQDGRITRWPYYNITVKFISLTSVTMMFLIKYYDKIISIIKVNCYNFPAANRSSRSSKQEATLRRKLKHVWMN